MNFYPELPAAAQEKFVQKTNFKVGEIIQLAGLDWYVVRIFRGFAKLVSKKVIARGIFDAESKRFEESAIKGQLENLYHALLDPEKEIREFLSATTVSTSADDGLPVRKEFQSFSFGLLSAESYRALNRYLPPKALADCWTSTPVTYRDNNPLVLYINENGALLPSSVSREHGLHVTLICDREPLLQYINRYNLLRKKAVTRATEYIRRFNIQPQELYATAD